MKATSVQLTRKEDALAAGGLTFDAAMESPCATCSTAPCCSHLPLPGIPVETLMQVDHARYLLGFDGIELGVAANGQWSVFYTRACRFLDPADNSCTLHGLPEQPRVCQHYNPYSCWYKRALVPDATDEYLRVDERRFAALLPHLRFDDERNLVAVPEWSLLQELFADLPIGGGGRELRGIPADPVREEWSAVVLEAKPAPAAALAALHVRDAPLADPCSGCAAYCCEHLQFFMDPPTTTASVDYLRFALGFQGVELGVGDDGWSLVVRTTCRHLEGGRCSLYGKDERPLRCRYFDAAHCPYPSMLGTPQPEGFVRFDLSLWEGFEAALQFDGFGNLLALPSAGEVRASVEDWWRAKVTADAS
jgi:hypothetical protein